MSAKDGILVSLVNCKNFKLKLADLRFKKRLYLFKNKRLLILDDFISKKIPIKLPKCIHLLNITRRAEKNCVVNKY